MSLGDLDDRPEAVPEGLVKKAAQHLGDILGIAIAHRPSQRALVVFDMRSALSRLLQAAYARVLPEAERLDFDKHEPQALLDRLMRLEAGDLAVLVQSENFRLETFRLRVELFKRDIRVVEHMHLQRMQGHEVETYVDSLAYDPGYLRSTGRALKQCLDAASGAVIDTGGALLTYASPFEDAKLNVGDYTGMTKIGGLFPIGEVFTEARDLTALHGRLRLFAFADIDFTVNRPESPITLVIESGRVAGVENGTPACERVLDQIRRDEGEIWVRELGFGLNRAFTRERMVRDVGTYERMCGVHFSLGAKHAVYPKTGFRRKDTRHHVDVFADARSVTLDGREVYRDGAYCIGAGPLTSMNFNARDT